MITIITAADLHKLCWWAAVDSQGRLGGGSPYLSTQQGEATLGSPGRCPKGFCTWPPLSGRGWPGTPPGGGRPLPGSQARSWWGSLLAHTWYWDHTRITHMQLSSPWVSPPGPAWGIFYGLCWQLGPEASFRVQISCPYPLYLRFPVAGRAETETVKQLTRKLTWDRKLYFQIQFPCSETYPREIHLYYVYDEGYNNV